VTSLSGDEPNVEAIAVYKPDLVVVADDTSHVVAHLQSLEIAVLVEPPATNLANAYDEIEQLADATGHAEQGHRVVSDLHSQIDAVVRSSSHPARPLTVYHELDGTYYSATSHTFIGQIYTLLGLTDIADKAGSAGDYPQLSPEYIVASSPDLIVLADTACCGQTPATVAARPGWRNIAAVKDGDVLAEDDSIASEWGPRIVQFLKDVAAASERAQEHLG
jgi:iron complex transport system substrate-binding protein